MTIDAAAKARIFSKIDQEELIQLAMSLADISSPTGSEANVANFILNWFEANGFQPVRQTVEPGRFNAIGMLRGTGNGKSLTFNGHMDTVFLPEAIKKAYASEGLIHGNQIDNMKAGLATVLIAAKAIKESGVRLAGDLVIAAVVGEICT